MKETEEYGKMVKEHILRQRAFFEQGKTKELDFRLKQLKTLERTIKKYEGDILDALHVDLKKSREEGYLTEVSIVLGDLKLHIAKLAQWLKPHKVPTPVHLLPSKSYTVFEPFGVTLILSPWNYPFQLLLNPLVGAISAGNCAILKPSHFSPATNEVIKTIIREAFPPEYVCVLEGGAEQTHRMLEEKFDFIFFTGSTSFGKEVMKAAAEHLTPVVLELGGKSPCIVDLGCDVKVAAKRIAWGKLLNAGQTCVAPDYILVHKSLERPLIDALQVYMTEFYGEDASLSPYYPRIIHAGAFNRLKSYLQEGEIVFGGKTDENGRYISPTVMRNIKEGSAILENEIFGPILPILTYEQTDEAVNYINARPKPLALYYFGKLKQGEEVLKRTSSGGACINDVVVHIANHNLPFGGVGDSGMGKYHGIYSFQAFSNERSVMISPAKLDFVFKYVPFKYFPMLKRFV